MYHVSQEVKKIITDQLVEGKTRKQVADVLNKTNFVSPTTDGKWNDKVISMLAIKWGYRKVSRLSKREKKSLAAKKGWESRQTTQEKTWSIDDTDEIKEIANANLSKQTRIKLLRLLINT